MSSDDPTAPPRRRRTRLVHAGRAPDEQFGFVNVPIYRGSTVLFATLDALEGGRQRFGYGRRGSPTYRALEEAWSDLAGAADTVLTPSGLSAVTLALLTVAKAGGHLLVSDGVYLPSRQFCDGALKALGVETTYFDPLDLAGLERLFKPETSAILVEAPSSQTMEMPDAPAIFALARARGVATLIDDTWATPLFLDAHAKGADLVIDAGTKYLGGHSDILLGLVS
ncbi:MAG: PLP-dependent transferase, partial [Hyphomicrobiales bacterium]|nr:PLP-dependent transferase [Hyphomicrobiales bacterium]